MMIAVTKSKVTGKPVLIIGLSEDDLVSLIEPNSPIALPLDGSSPTADRPTPGMEAWELVVIGPADSAVLLEAAREAAAEGDETKT